MTSITIENLTDEEVQGLHFHRAARNGRTMEVEAHAILDAALDAAPRVEAPQPRRNLAKEIRELFGPRGGVDLAEMKRDPPKFE